jgi:hypothetical protein
MLFDDSILLIYLHPHKCNNYELRLLIHNSIDDDEMNIDINLPNISCAVLKAEPRYGTSTVLPSDARYSATPPD